MLVDSSVDKTSPLETDVNDWELFFMRCCIPLALSMNNRGLTGTIMSLCFMTTSEKVRTQKLISGNVYIEAIRSRSTNLSLRTKERGQVETHWLHTSRLSHVAKNWPRCPCESTISCDISIWQAIPIHFRCIIITNESY